MTEQTPLYQAHQRLGAAFSERFGWHIPSHYNTTAQEYEALRHGSGLVDRSPVGRVRATGKDSLDLLNRLSTNDLATLPSGTGTGTVLTSNKGRILDLLIVTARPDHLVYLTGPSRRRTVLEWVDFYAFDEDSLLEDVTDTTAMLGVHGPKSALALSRAGCDVSALPLYSSMISQVGGVLSVVVRTDAAGIVGYDLIVQAINSTDLFAALVETGVVPVGYDAFEAVRVEHGVPAADSELTEEYNPLEARLKGLVSFNKGCYVGQEVVTRLDTYDKVKRLLMFAWLDCDARPGDALELDGKVAGVITSVAHIPIDDHLIGLSYVRRSLAKPGQYLKVAGRKGIAELADPLFAMAMETKMDSLTT